MSTAYEATLEYLFQQLPMYQRVGPVAYKKDLGNIRALCEALGNPQDCFPSIHIAGTNGKGSTANMLAACLQAAGHRVGLYTSPHYRDFRERMRVDGALPPETFVVDFVRKHKALLEDVRPSFFEITVAMAFVLFAEAQVDMAVVEVGLGGRLDSTNIITPLLSVITNISYDHQNLLGNTLPEIAGEKAGIIKGGVPVVIGERQAETDPVFVAKATEVDAPLTFAEDRVQVEELRAGTYAIRESGAPGHAELAVEVGGPYQAKNIQTTLAALSQLPHPWKIGEKALRNGLSKISQYTGFMGRWQVLQNDPLVICDSAHNVAGITAALSGLKSWPVEDQHFVLGMVTDKDAIKMLSLFPSKAHYYFCRPEVPRGRDATELQQAAAQLGMMGEAYPSVGAALAAAKKQVAQNGVVYVGGSIFVVAEVI